MTTDARMVFQNIPDPFACCEIECEHLDGRTLRACEEARCCFAYQRQREEELVEREAKDAKERMNNHA